MVGDIKSLLVLFIALVVVSSGCTGQSSKPSHSVEPKVAWKPDGFISPGEYSLNYTTEDGSFSVFLRVENDTFFVGIEARTRGWLAVGFGGGPGMKKTDIIIAYVLPNGTVKIRDDYSTGFAGPHNPDTMYGGEYNILSYGGRDENGLTVVEFSRKLNTGDKYDFKLPTNESFRVIWAYGVTDDFLSNHVRAGSFRVNLGVVE